jgi:hypothetical protein
MKTHDAKPVKENSVTIPFQWFCTNNVALGNNGDNVQRIKTYGKKGCLKPERLYEHVCSYAVSS